MIHVAIISHGHEDLLISSQLGGLRDAPHPIHIWVKDNKPSAKLKAYCQQHGVSYSDQRPGLGFGENNNYLFEQVKKKHGFQASDAFVVMNPDITIKAETISLLIAQMQHDHALLASINLFRDPAHKNHDFNIRHFPDILSPFRMLSSRSLTQTYDKTQIAGACEVDWASGALLAFDAEHYARLGGFDAHYFMYFEDVDLCYRSKKLLNAGVRYYPQFKATHLAARQSRNLMSPHASWFIRSFLTFLSRRYFVYSRPSAASANR
jgi:N-acetylglucosaminyl-diphospho-decaprenol L-rhamnosyltransferase